MAVKLTHTFTGTGTSDPVGLHGNFSLSISGITTATVKLQRSFDDGATWKNVKSYAADDEDVGFEPSFDVKYRFNCSAHTTGTVICALAQ